MTTAPKQNFSVRAQRVDAHGSLAHRKDAQITLDTGQDDRRLALLHDNVKKFGTVFNTVTHGTALSGVLPRLTPNDLERLP
ncbi:MAG: hypothetical protein U5L03_12570 [Burkholderiaceae bacterium]|nr:hypothetical protein [Burkholderiaceae bacterium]